MIGPETAPGALSLREVPGWPRISRDYVGKAGRAAEFFNGDFRDPAAFDRQAEAVRKRSLRREALAAVLIDQNRRYGCGPRTLARIGQIDLERAGAIVTGQQVGLFSGPLYTIYKALTAVKLADSLAAAGRGAFVPIFWMASDDHDAAEVDHIGILDRDNAPQRLRCPFPSPDAKIPLRERPVPDEVQETLRRLDELTPDSEFKADVLARLKDDYAPGRPFTEAFGRWMTRLFGASGLVLLDPGDPRLRELGADVFRREISGDSPSTLRALETSARLAEAGYDPAIHLHEGVLNLFFVDSERRTVESKKDGFLIKETGRRFGRDELTALAERRARPLQPQRPPAPPLSGRPAAYGGVYRRPGRDRLLRPDERDLRELRSAHAPPRPALHGDDPGEQDRPRPGQVRDPAARALARRGGDDRPDRRSADPRKRPAGGWPGPTGI